MGISNSDDFRAPAGEGGVPQERVHEESSVPASAGGPAYSAPDNAGMESPAIFDLCSSPEERLGPNIIVTAQTPADYVSDPRVLRERISGIDQRIEDIATVRDALTTSRGTSLIGDNYWWAASVPWWVLGAVEKHYGREALWADNGKLFFEWLNRHPEWKVLG